MKKRNILICNEQLNIGGVETAVLTMSKGYIDKGYNVFVAAGDGIFKKELEKIGVKVLVLNYEIGNKIPYDKQEELKKFCLENDITEVHFHQYPCVLYWLPICMELNIPYVAYVHSILPGTPQWFMRDFPIYKVVLPIFFYFASKVICISLNTKKELQSLFNIDESKYKIIHNSLYMNDFKSNKDVNSINNFIIVSRLSFEKESSVKKAIDFYKEYKKINKKAKLVIAGDGDKKEEIKRYASDTSIKFLGQRNDVSKLLDEADVLLGVDRCILESLSMKRISIISSYDGKLSLINKDNLILASESNFSGKGLDFTEVDILIKKLNNLSKKDIKDIVDYNYNYVNDNYNIMNNLFDDELLKIENNSFDIVFNELGNYNNSDNSINSNKKCYINNLFIRIINRVKRILKR